MQNTAIKAFQEGELSFGQLSKDLSKNHHEAMKLLGSLNIPIADYDLEEDLKTVDWLMAQEAAGDSKKYEV